jgi:glyoxylase-like metal-dependent hydrolase (beta-lactamase superfamily II)
MEVAKGIHRITQGVVNFYLVEEAGAFALVDAGTPKDWDAMMAELASLDGGIGDLRAVLLTHAHADHAGFAEQARTTTGAGVWVHRDDTAVAKGATPPKNDGSMLRYLFRPEFYRTSFSLARRGGTKILPVQELSAYGDGEVLDVPGRPRVVHAPGHTPGTAALFLEDRRALLSGDALVTRNPLTGRTGPQIMPSGFNQSTGQALASLTLLEAIPAEVILPGHGEPWTDGAADAVKWARRAGRS